MTTVSLAHANLPTSETSVVDETIFARGRENADPGLTEDSQPQPDVPKGRLTKARHVGTSIYPGVGRDYWVYVPAQHDAARPANLLVVQDAGFYLRESFGAATVLDNLVARGDIPPVVAVFVEPGDLPGEAENSRGNRSIEYDTLGTTYPRFLLEELLPEALAGLAVSTDPADRAICGMSSGGICAFNAAWEYPDSFGRVISHVGSFTNIRGGHVYPSMVRKHDPKPIRVFLQGAQNDLDREAGNWPAANFDMASALRFKGYDYRFEFGPGAHDLRHGGWTFPATLRWIWR